MAPSDDEASLDNEPAATLGDLFGRLDLGEIQLVYEPLAGEPLTGIVIDDPAAPAEIERGSVVLAVGAHAQKSDALDLVERAGRASAAAIVFRFDGTPPRELLDAAESAGVAVLGIPADREWDYVYTVLQGAVVASSALGGFLAPPSDLFALAEAIAARVGGGVTIEDVDGRLLAFSGHDESIDELRRQTILHRRVPAQDPQWAHHVKRANPRNTYGVRRYEFTPEEGLRSRLEIAVRAGGEILGDISVIEGDNPLGEEAERALEDAARVAALHLIHHRISQSLDRRVRGNLVRSLLDGSGSAATVATRLGIDPLRHVTVVAIEVGPERPYQEIEVERALGLVWLRFQATYRQSLAASIGRTIYVIVCTSDPEDVQRIIALTKRAIDDASVSSEHPLRAGVGSTVPDLSGVTRSRAEADLAVRVLIERESSDAVASIDDVRTRAIMLRLREIAAGNDELLSGKVLILAEHDAAHRTEYVRTLRAYLDALGEGIPAACARLGIHPNTMRYRLRKIADLSGLNLDDPEERVVAEIQLRLL